MKKINLNLILSLTLMALVSCGEPDTVVTNIVHQDGSVTRKIVMRSDKNKFEKSDFQVPFDNSWDVKDSLEVDQKGDTTWIRRCEKLFTSVNEINATYKNDSSINGKISRHAAFNKRFRWFNTEYMFSEIVDKQLLSGYSIKSFLNKEEQIHFYSPDYIKFNKENGTDSLKYRALSDSIKLKTDNWIMKNIASLWIKEFARLIGPNAGPGLTLETLQSREDEFVDILNQNQEIFDSLWTKGIILKKVIGEADAIKFKTEADSAVTLALSRFLEDFKDYSVRIALPGKLIATNGYIDSTRNLLWPVKSDFFLTDSYEMWAESKTTNIWAWIVTGLFLIFVSAGILLKEKSRLRGGTKTIT